MGRRFWVSDIHGHFDALNVLLRATKFDPTEDILFIGGDLINRGPKSGLVLKEVMRIQKKYPDNICVLKGNHESAFISMLANEIPAEDYERAYGGEGVVEQIFDHFPTEALRKEVLHWIDALPTILGDEDFVYVHAGYRAGGSQTEEDLLWMSNRDMLSQDIYDLRNQIAGRIVVRGHSPQKAGVNLHKGTILSCDCGAGFPGGSLAMVHLEDGMVTLVHTETLAVTTESIANITR